MRKETGENTLTSGILTLLEAEDSNCKLRQCDIVREKLPT